jgi:uncharacterized protein (TIGR00730 family)
MKNFDFDLTKPYPKAICVFCSSSEALEEVYYVAARELGVLIAKNGYNLVHGGGKIGLMGTLAATVQESGAKVTGVLPERLNLEGIASETDDEIIITKDMPDRKTEMRKRSEAFITMPGGFGTLEELAEVLTLKQLGYHTKPVVILNTNNYYENLIGLFEKMYKLNFAKPDFKSLYHISPTPADAMNHILNYKYVEVKDKWFLKRG